MPIRSIDYQWYFFPFFSSLQALLFESFLKYLEYEKKPGKKTNHKEVEVTTHLSTWLPFCWLGPDGQGRRWTSLTRVVTWKKLKVIWYSSSSLNHPWLLQTFIVVHIPECYWLLAHVSIKDTHVIISSLSMTSISDTVMLWWDEVSQSNIFDIWLRNHPEVVKSPLRSSAHSSMIWLV